MSTPDPRHGPPDDDRPGSTPRGDRRRRRDDEEPDLAFGRLYGRAPRTGGGNDQWVRTTYTFVLVWFVCALIMWYGSRMFGFERGDIGAAVVSLVVSLVAAVIIVTAVRRRRR